MIFTPPYTPEANPIIESFNRVWDRNFWQRTQFVDLVHISKELSHFESYCRLRRPLAQFKGLSAAEVAPDFQPAQLSPHFQWPEQPLPLTAGFVHFIRFVDHEGAFSCLNESWQLHKENWAHKTVRATIDTARQQLHVFHQEQSHAAPVRIATFDYALREAVQPLLSCYRRPAPCLWPGSTS